MLIQPHSSFILNLLLFSPTLISTQEAQQILTSSLGSDAVPLAIHEYWMRYANTLYAELTPSHTPCPFNAFAAVVVNHTAPATDEYPFGTPICTGVNGVNEFENPTLHGEIAAINNCSSIFQNQIRAGDLRGGKMWTDLTIYSTAEPCPMCASAIRWAGFKECIFGSKRTKMAKMGWPLIGISTQEVFWRSTKLDGVTGLIGGVLANETDPYFVWQYDGEAPCPAGCDRDFEREGACAKI